MNWYNEIDPKAAAWLRQLIANKLIPYGIVDERSIVNVPAADLRGFTQCHFFAGIGGWSRALELARIPVGRKVWTGSCPCQPFSNAGEQLGFSDPRHLWPHFFRLIAECRPATVIGEQVASKLGRQWLAGVRADLEGVGYAVGGADLCAAGVGAPHIRQRLYWVAYAESERFDGSAGMQGADGRGIVEAGGVDGRLADANSGECDGLSDGEGCESDGSEAGRQQGDGELERSGAARRLANANGRQPRHGELQPCGEHGQQQEDGGACRLGHTYLPRREQQCRADPVSAQQPAAELRGDAGFWSAFNLVRCTDGKVRRVPTEPEFQPLAHGVSGRVAALRGYGNAIVPEAAAQFIRAAELARSDLSLTPTYVFP